MGVRRAFGVLYILVIIGACDAAWAQNCAQRDPDTNLCIGPQIAGIDHLPLSLTPPANRTKLDPYGIYRVAVVCKETKPLPVETNSGIFARNNVATAHTIAITDQGVTSSAFPAADKAKAVIGVFAVSGDTKNRSGFVNRACDTDFFISARKPLFLAASAAKATAASPSVLTQALYNVVKIVIPIWPLFTGTALAGEIKNQLTAVKDSEQPLKDFFAGFDNGITSTIVQPLYVGTHVIKTEYSRVTVSVTRLKSIIQLGNDTFRAAFEDTFIVLKDQIAPAAGPLNADQFSLKCASIRNQLAAPGLSTYDATYALGYAAHQAGLAPDKVMDCLGRDHALIAANEFEATYWKDYAGTFTKEDVRSHFPEVKPWPVPPPFPGAVETRYRQMMLVLGMYAQPETPPDSVAKMLGGYLAAKIEVSNETDRFPFLETNPSNVEFMKVLTDKGYRRFGCVASDTQALGMFLAFPLKPTADGGQYKTSDALLLRTWFDADRRVARVRISDDYTTVEGILTKYGRRCGETVVVAPPPKPPTS